MTDSSTAGMDLRFLSPEELTRFLDRSLQQQVGTSEPLDLSRAAFARPGTVGPFRSALAAVLTAVGTSIADRNCSQRIHPVWSSLVQQHRDYRDEQVADFFEPVRFTWNERRYRVRVAARQYSRETHADY